MQHGRGVALADFNRDGKTDIVYGNWNGPHRLYIQLNNRKQKFKVGRNVFSWAFNNSVYTRMPTVTQKFIVSVLVLRSYYVSSKLIRRVCTCSQSLHSKGR